jgi:hypothetical protein
MRVVRQWPVLILLAAYVATGPLVDLIHRDASSSRIAPIAGVDAHGCGEKEKHIPIDGIHQCAVCAESNQRLAVPVSPPVTGSPTLLCTGRVVHTIHRTTGPLLAPLHPRGPPAA